MTVDLVQSVLKAFVHHVPQWLMVLHALQAATLWSSVLLYSMPSWW